MTSVTAATRPVPTMEPEFKSALAAGEKAPKDHYEFVVMLDDQATREVEKAFAMPVGIERRQFVAKTLIEKMATTQAPLWKVLDGLQATGDVSAYAPVWIQNSIIVHGNERAATIMSQAAGVSQATKSALHVLDLPGRNVDVLAANDAIDGVGSLADLPVDVDTTAVNAATKADKAPFADDPQWNLTRMGIDKARKEKLTGKGVTVAVIDTGLDANHPFLLSKYRGYDATSGSRNDLGNWYDSVPAPSGTPVDDGAHGTHVGGTIAGEYDGVQTGVAPDVDLMAARGLGPEGGTDGMLLRSFQNTVAPRVPTPGVSPGSKRVIALGPDIINNSWGSDDGASTSYMHALRNMAAMGVINFFAAGNDGGGAGTIGSPGSSPYIITVGATDKNDNAAGFSSRGPNPLPVQNGEPVPFIAMPGTEIRSTIPGGGIEENWQGTSMATPLAAGLGALILQAAEEETGRKFDIIGMKETLKRLAQDVGPKGVDDETGYGIPVAGKIRATVRAVAKDLGLMTESTPKK